MVARSPFAVVAGLGVFPNLTRRADVLSKASPSTHELGFPFRDSLRGPGVNHASHSHEVFVPFSASIRKTRFPRACLTRHLPPPGFFILLTCCFPSDPLALFHASNALGVRSFRAFFLSQSLLNLSIQATLVMLELVHRNRRNPHLQGFTPCSKPFLLLLACTVRIRSLPSCFSTL